MTIERPASGADPARSRNRRIRELRDRDRSHWTLRRLGREFNLSHQRIVEILAAETTTDDREVAVLERELGYRLELVDLLEKRHRPDLEDLEREDCRSRIVVVTRALRQIAEERESRAINRLLGVD